MKLALRHRPGPAATLLVLASTLSLGGCLFSSEDDNDDRPARPGELGAGQFRYICVGDADPFCDEGFTATTFPERFAVGGRFDLEFDPDSGFFSSDEFVPRIIAPALSSVRTEAMTYAFLRQGYAAFMARDNDGTIIDIRHFFAAPVARIAVKSQDSEDLAMIELGVGQDSIVEAIPQDDFRSTLAGSLDYVWTTDDPAIAEVISADLDFDIAIRGVAEGETTLRIRTGEFEQTLSIVISADGPPDPTDTDTDSAGETDTQTEPTTDTGSSTDTDTDTDSSSSSDGTDTDPTSSSTTGGGQ